MLRRTHFCLHLIIALFALNTSALAQISGVINSYTEVTLVDVANSQVTVNNAVAFSVGDRVMIMQMTGAAIDQTNTATFGDISALGSTGNYDVLEICNIAGTDIAFSQEFSRVYDIVNGQVQLISVPQYSSETVNATLSCAPWNGTEGGVLVMEVSNTLTLSANIDVSGLGFGGGSVNGLTAQVCDEADYFESNATTTSAGKGAGVAAFIVGKENARGKQGNGAGGGNSWSAGGGGGANGGAGGNGGNNNDGGGCSGNAVGGRGGANLPQLSAANRLFMGGGGGGGHNSSGGGVAGAGGAGGAIVIILADEIVGNSFSILSNGADGTDVAGATAEGAGGAGSGGTIALDIKTYTGTLLVHANGAAGGDNGNPANCYGPGGGGGGGAVWSTVPLPANVSSFVNQGSAGFKTGGPGSCASTTYGATNGSLGELVTGFQIAFGDGPSAGANGSLTACNTETAVDLETGLTAAFNPGGTWNDDDATGALTGQFFNASTAGAGNYDFTYTVTSGTCADSSATVTVAVTNVFDAGSNNSISECNDNNAVDLFANLGGTPDGGGIWSDDDASGELSAGFFDASAVTAGTYDFTYTLQGQGTCATATATVSVSVSEAPSAGIDGTANVCEIETAVDLSGLLNGTPDAGGAWDDDDATGALTGSFFNASSVGLGTYHFTYVVTGAAPCVNDSATVTIVVANAPNAGVGTTLTACIDGTPIDLFANLTGSPDASGGWFDVDGSGGLLSGFFNLSVVAAGTYDLVYIVSALGGCVADSSTITIVVTSAADAGQSAGVTVCEAETAVDLFSLLGGTPDLGGVWTDDDGTGAMAAGIFDASAVALGTYDFSYFISGSGPCPGATTTVTVSVVTAADAGGNGATTLCNDLSSFDLFTLLTGTPTSGGSWLDNDATGALSGQTFDATQVGAGVYSFTYIANSLGVCPDDSADVTITVNQAPDGGNNGVIPVCQGNTGVDLFSGLLGTPDAGGTWIDNDLTGALTGGIFDASLVATGNYSFTYFVTGTAPCVNDSVNITVLVTPGPSAGQDGSLIVCSSESLVDLFTGLGGTPNPGGAWLDDDATGGLNGGFLNAGLITVAGTYNFTYVASVPGCVGDSAVVSVTVTLAPNAGGDSTVTVCTSLNSLDLFSGLIGTPDAGGTWVDDDLTGALTGNIFDATIVAPGTYSFTYIVSGTTPCSGDASNVLVSVVATTDAGTNGTLNACTSQSNIDLFSGLGGTPYGGGAWIDDDATGALTAGYFNASLTAAGTYDFTYVIAAGGCPNDSATVSVTVTEATSAGTNGTLASCLDVTSVDLFTGLGGTPDLGGIWNDDNGSGALTGSIFDPSAAATGTFSFTYLVSGTPPCTDATSTVIVTVNAPPNAGTNGTLDVCDTETNISLAFGLGGTPDGGGSWDDDEATGGLNGSNFDASTVTAGTYNFTYIVAPTGCIADSATVAVTVTEGPDPGANASVQVCGSNSAFDLITALGGTPDLGGTWADDDGSGALSGGMFDATLVAPGVYGFTYSVIGTPPCNSAQATVFVIVTQGANAGVDSTLSACDNDNIVDLFTGLGGTFDGFGTWVDDDATGALSGSSLDATVAGFGTFDFTYVVAINGCISDSATVTVTVANGPDAGTPDTVNICNTNANYDLFSGLQGTPEAGGTWSDDDNSGALVGAAFNASAVGNGTYHFTYSVTGNPSCLPASATMVVVVTAAPDAGTDGQLGVCSDQTFVDLITSLGGTPGLGGFWTDNNGSGGLTGGFLDASIAGAGVWSYTYTIDAIGCPSSSAVALITIDQAVDAGQDATMTICLGETVNLWTTLAGTPDIGGVWTDALNSGGLTDSIFNSTGLSAGSYLFNYSLSGQDYCQDSEAAIIVIVEGVPFAGIGDTIEVCQTFVDLYAGLTGAYSSGGTWSDDDASGLMLSANLVDGQDATADAIYHFSYTVTTVNCGFDVTTVVIATCDNSGTLAPPEGFSPNDDGVNDLFVIDGIERFPQNTLTIFNRFGNTVFAASPYEKDWDGRWDQENRAGDGLPIGTYFYILDLGNDTDPITGYIYLNR